MASAHASIGIDVGRSTVKAVALQGGRRFDVIFPTAIVPAKAVIYDALKEMIKRDSVEVGENEFWVGELALSQNLGADPIGRTDDWIVSPQHDALVGSALKRLITAGLQYKADDATFYLGVPSRVFKDRKELVNTMKGNASSVLSVKGKQPRVLAYAQPMGVISAYTLNDDGSPRDGIEIDKEGYAVIEVGQYTTDFSAVYKGMPLVDATESCEGVELIATSIRTDLRTMDIELGIADVHDLITSRQIKNRGKLIDLGPQIENAISNILIPKIMETMHRCFPKSLLQATDRLLVAGGGAPIVFAHIAKDPVLADQSVLVDDPRMAVAYGFAKLAAMASRV